MGGGGEVELGNLEVIDGEGGAVGAVEEVEDSSGNGSEKEKEDEGEGCP